MSSKKILFLHYGVFLHLLFNCFFSSWGPRGGNTYGRMQGLPLDGLAVHPSAPREHFVLFVHYGNWDILTIYMWWVRSIKRRIWTLTGVHADHQPTVDMWASELDREYGNLHSTSKVTRKVSLRVNTVHSFNVPSIWLPVAGECVWPQTKKASEFVWGNWLKNYFVDLTFKSCYNVYLSEELKLRRCPI